MGVLDWFYKSPTLQAETKVDVFANMHYTPIFSYSYDGEKTPGEMGSVKRYYPNYNALRARSWQSYLESEITQTVINKFSKWVIGKGLRLQCDPSKEILLEEGIDIDFDKFQQTVESRFKVYSRSKKSTHSENVNLHSLAKKAHINAIIGGDVLVVLRYDGKKVSGQLIDGAHLQTPILNSVKINKDNDIRHGVEINKKGTHVAYHVLTSDNKYQRIPAINKTSGKRVAFLMYGLQYRLDEVRGIPLISAVLETLKKLDRYKEATVGSAEERQKIAYTIDHDSNSTGENPMLKNIGVAFNAGMPTAPETNTPSGEEVATKIATTTQKQAWNMPIGSHLRLLESKNELYFKDFYTVNINIVCAALGIPPEVALSKYDSNFSASRAALKDWEHTIDVERDSFSGEFYKNFYNFWLFTEVLDSKILASGYVKASIDDDYMVVGAYENCRFSGANIPHIDPLKEVLAERKKLGSLADHIPLTTVENSTEALGSGEYSANVAHFKEELKKAPETPKQEVNNSNNNVNTE